MRVLLVTRRAAVPARTAATCQLKALVVTAPPELRESLRGLTRTQLIRTCARLHRMQCHDAERRGAVLALRATARRIEFLTEEAAEFRDELAGLVQAACPDLVELPGVGVLSAAPVLVSWSHPGRIRSEAAFAAVAGAAPIPASSGQHVRHRLCRSGDRQLNRALHNIVLAACDTTAPPATMSNGAAGKDAAPRRSNAASNEASRDSSSGSSPATRSFTLDIHRSISSRSVRLKRSTLPFHWGRRGGNRRWVTPLAWTAAWKACAL